MFFVQQMSINSDNIDRVIIYEVNIKNYLCLVFEGSKLEIPNENFVIAVTYQ